MLTFWIHITIKALNIDINMNIRFITKQKLLKFRYQESRLVDTIRVLIQMEH